MRPKPPFNICNTWMLGSKSSIPGSWRISAREPFGISKQTSLCCTPVMRPNLYMSWKVKPCRNAVEMPKGNKSQPSSTTAWLTIRWPHLLAVDADALKSSPCWSLALELANLHHARYSRPLARRYARQQDGHPTMMRYEKGTLP